MRTLIMILLTAALAACQDEPQPKPVPSQPLPASPGAAEPAQAPAAAPADEPAPAPVTDPLAALAPLERTLGGGMDALIKGTSAEQAFGGLAVRASDARISQLRGDTAAAGVKTVGLNMVEIDVRFLKGEQIVYELDAEILMTEGRRGFLEIRGRPVQVGTGISPGRELKALAGPLAPIAETIEQLVAAAKGPGCAKLPIASEADMRALLPPKHAAKVPEAAAKAHVQLGELCRDVAKLDSDGLRVRLDDVIFGARAADGALIGVVKAELEAERDGSTALEIKRYKPHVQ